MPDRNVECKMLDVFCYGICGMYSEWSHNGDSTESILKATNPNSRARSPKEA